MAIPENANKYIRSLLEAVTPQEPAQPQGEPGVEAALAQPQGEPADDPAQRPVLPPRVRKLTGFLGPRDGDGPRTLYTTHALDEGVYVRQTDILFHTQAPPDDADGLRRDVLVVSDDAVIIRWYVEERRYDRRGRVGGGGGSGGIDDGNRAGLI